MQGLPYDLLLYISIDGSRVEAQYTPVAVHSFFSFYPIFIHLIKAKYTLLFAFIRSFSYYMHKSALLGLLASSPVSAQLNSLAQGAGLKYFGSAVDNGYLSDATYAKLANNVEEFGQLVPENGQKWETVEPTRDQFTYTTADVVPDLAKKNKQILRCHALTWHSQLPKWGEFVQALFEMMFSNK
jgi:GH35 family endo-1,4-beta-xylanase